MADGIYSAIQMPLKQRQLRHEKHWRYVSQHTVGYWAQSFVSGMPNQSHNVRLRLNSVDSSLLSVCVASCVLLVPVFYLLQTERSKFSFFDFCRYAKGDEEPYEHEMLWARPWIGYLPNGCFGCELQEIGGLHRAEQLSSVRKLQSNDQLSLSRTILQCLE